MIYKNELKELVNTNCYSKEIHKYLFVSVFLQLLESAITVFNGMFYKKNPELIFIF